LREFRFTKPDERATPSDLQHMLSLAYTIKQNHYDSAQVLQHSGVVLQDLVFNSILAAANESLERLAEFAGEALPDDLHSRFAQTRRAIEQLWDHDAGELVRVPTIAAFMPLFAGTASPAHAEQLRLLLTDRHGGYHTNFALPSVPDTSRLFEPNRYWRGPVWINMNWFVIIGLERYGFTQEAADLRRRTLELVAGSGFREYYNPLTGAGLGATNFSWSAALTLDMLAHVPIRQLVYR
jgi:glycogen debranching enzyme